MRAILPVLLCLGLSAGPASAGSYRCDWAQVADAGGAMSGTAFRVGATAGVTAAGRMSNLSYRLFLGFWQAEYGTGVIERESPVLPEGPATRLETIAPNPLPGRGRIRYSLGSAGPVSITIHDLVGRRVRTLVNGPQPAGRYTVTWQGEDDAGRELANGIYFCRFSADEVRSTSKLVLAR